MTSHMTLRSRRPVALLTGAAFTLLLTSCVTPWLQFGGDAQHRSNNTLETTLTLANVNQLKQKWQITLPATADGAPVIANGVVLSWLMM